MTIRVTVTNADTRPTAVIAVHTTGKDFAVGPGYPTPVELAGGESNEFWVHSNQELHVKEVKQ